MADLRVWRTLLVDDDPDVRRQLEENLNDLKLNDLDAFKPQSEGDFGKALQLIEERRFDILVLDVYKGEVGGNSRDGIDVLSQVKERQFLPVIFYTALPRIVEELGTPPVIQVVAKDSGFGKLQEAIEKLMHSGLPQLNRAFTEHSASVLREYLWDFMPKHWEMLLADGEPIHLAYVLCRRLANSLDGRGAERLAETIMDREAAEATEDANDKVHPMQYYILPPVDDSNHVGDIVKDNHDGAYWVVLTPTCDFAHGKASYVLLARGVLLKDRDEYKDWIADQKDLKANQKLKDLLTNNPQKAQRDRFWFLPGAMQLPPLLIDLQETKTTRMAEFRGLEKVATLDSPFAEALVQRYSRFFGRIGCPDLDTEAVIQELSREVAKSG